MEMFASYVDKFGGCGGVEICSRLLFFTKEILAILFTWGGLGGGGGQGVENARNCLQSLQTFP